jgi:hypothetical protein
MAAALAPVFGDRTARDVAFHLTDWNSNAAFLVALLLSPESFTAEEIRGEVQAFLVHAPNHVAAAAKLGGWPVEDVWGLRVFERDE